jgi:hypothetical protein
MAILIIAAVVAAMAVAYVLNLFMSVAMTVIVMLLGVAFFGVLLGPGFNGGESCGK